MKRTLLLILTAVMLLGTVSCGKKDAGMTENEETADALVEEEGQDKDGGEVNYTPSVPLTDITEEPADESASDPAEGRELILECEDDTNARVTVPAVFININQSISSMAHASTEDGKLSASYKASSLSLDRATEEVTKKVIEHTKWEDCDEEPDISDREEQDVNGRKCLWYKMSFSINGEKRANIFGDMGSEDGESSISIMLFAEGEDAVNIVDDTWQNIISGIEF